MGKEKKRKEKKRKENRKEGKKRKYRRRKEKRRKEKSRKESQREKKISKILASPVAKNRYQLINSNTTTNPIQSNLMILMSINLILPNLCLYHQDSYAFGLMSV